MRNNRAAFGQTTPPPRDRRRGSGRQGPRRSANNRASARRPRHRHHRPISGDRGWLAMEATNATDALRV